MFDRIQQVIGNYQLLKLLKQDAFIEVYLGEDQHNQKQVVIKVLDKRMKTGGNVVEHHTSDAFIHVAHIMARLDHPNIVPFYNLGEQAYGKDALLYLVTYYAANGSVRQQYPKGSRVPLETIVAYVKQSASALHYAHDQDILHARLKPENILLGDGNKVLVSDFGFAKPVYLQTELSLSSVLYAAPEQILGNPQKASDQYALGIMVYEWLSGVLPFTGSAEEVLTQHVETPPPPLRDKLTHRSPLVEEVVLTALEKDPNRRFTTITAFATALEQASLDQGK